MDRLRPGRRTRCGEPSLRQDRPESTRATGQVWPQAWRRPGLPARILPEERTAGSPAGYLPATTVSSPARRRRPDGGRARPPGGGRRRRRGRGGRAVQLQRPPRTLLARPIAGTLPQAERQQVRDGPGWSLGRHVAAGHQPAPGRGQRRPAAAAALLAALGAASEAGPVGARSRQPGRRRPAGRPVGQRRRADPGRRRAAHPGRRLARPRSGRPRCATPRPRPGSCSRTSRRSPVRTGGPWARRWLGRRWPACALPRQPSSTRSASHPSSSPASPEAALLAAFALDGGNLADFIREGIT